MTTPNSPAPDGAYVVGSGYGQGMTEQSAKVAMKTAPVNAWSAAQANYHGSLDEQKRTLAARGDGQTALINRIGLLDEASGHAAAYMGFSWDVPQETWVALPYENQLGPAKRAGVNTADTTTGGLIIKAGGLWRVDTGLCIQGYSVGISFYMIGSILYSDTRYNPIVPTYLLEVVNSTGTVLTSRRFDAVSGVAPNQMTQEAVNKPVSTSFSHTFVLEDMPPEDDPTAPEHWAYVRLSMRWYPVWSGTFGGAVCKALGGTKLTSMTASRWSRDVANTNQPATVPDGGTLT